MEPKEGGQILNRARWLETQGKYSQVITLLSASPFLRHINFKRRFTKLLCRNYNCLGKYQLAKDHAIQIMNMLKFWKADAFKRDYARAHFQLALALCGLSQHEECTKTLKQAIEYVEEHNLTDKMMFVRFYICSGKIGLSHQNYDEALLCFKRANELVKSIERKKHVRVVALQGIAECLNHTKKYKDSIQFYIEALQLISQKNTYVYAVISQQVSYVYASISQYELALVFQKEAYTVMRYILGAGDTRIQLYALHLSLLNKLVESQQLKKNDTQDWITRKVDYLKCKKCKERYAVLNTSRLCGKCTF